MTQIMLKLIFDDARVREWYDEHVEDVHWYRDNNQLDPEHPDRGYRTGDPGAYEEYAQAVITGVLSDVEYAGSCYRVERSEILVVESETVLSLRSRAQQILVAYPYLQDDWRMGTLIADLARSSG